MRVHPRPSEGPPAAILDPQGGSSAAICSCQKGSLRGKEGHDATARRVTTPRLQGGSRRHGTEERHQQQQGGSQRYSTEEGHNATTARRVTTPRQGGGTRRHGTEEGRCQRGGGGSRRQGKLEHQGGSRRQEGTYCNVTRMHQQKASKIELHMYKTNLTLLILNVW